MYCRVIFLLPSPPEGLWRRFRGDLGDQEIYLDKWLKALIMGFNCLLVKILYDSVIDILKEGPDATGIGTFTWNPSLT